MGSRCADADGQQCDGCVSSSRRRQLGSKPVRLASVAWTGSAERHVACFSRCRNEDTQRRCSLAPVPKVDADFCGIRSASAKRLGRLAVNRDSRCNECGSSCDSRWNASIDCLNGQGKLTRSAKNDIPSAGSPMPALRLAGNSRIMVSTQGPLPSLQASPAPRGDRLLPRCLYDNVDRSGRNVCDRVCCSPPHHLAESAVGIHRMGWSPGVDSRSSHRLSIRAHTLSGDRSHFPASLIDGAGLVPGRGRQR